MSEGSGPFGAPAGSGGTAFGFAAAIARSLGVGMAGEEKVATTIREGGGPWSTSLQPATRKAAASARGAELRSDIGGLLGTQGTRSEWRQLSRKTLPYLWRVDDEVKNVPIEEGHSVGAHQLTHCVLPEGEEPSGGGLLH